jgi:farnesyl diphosphate synthase
MMEHFENILELYINSIEMPAPQLREAIHYVLFPGGKRLRPQLVYLTGALLNVSIPILDPIAMAIELMHAYSLVHDDLPAMDNDILRRGRPTCHIAFTEACAILTGDALQSLAISVLTDTFPYDFPAEKKILIIKQLLFASGPSGMISGQALDLSLLSGPDAVSEPQLQTIHHLKTTKMFQACLSAVVQAADAKQHEQTLLDFGHHLGLAYQMQDDYLDTYAHQLIGKEQASDEANKKQTYSHFFSQETLKNKIQARFDTANELLLPFGDKATPFITFVNQLHRVKDLI